MKINKFMLTFKFVTIVMKSAKLLIYNNDDY